MEFQCLFQDVPACPFHVQWILNHSDVGVLPMSIPPATTQTNCNENDFKIGTMIIYLFEYQDIMWDNSEIVCIGRAVLSPNIIITSKSALLRIQGMCECICVTE